MNHSDGRKDVSGAIRWRDKSAELGFWRAYLDCVTRLRVLDPACGSGAFFIAAFDFLKAEQTRVRERLSELEPGLLVHWGTDTDVEIITRNLYGRRGTSGVGRDHKAFIMAVKKQRRKAVSSNCWTKQFAGVIA